VTRGKLTVREDPEAAEFEMGVSGRIGIRHNADWPLRFFIPRGVK
jgi:3-methyladenine DNA glycosylase Mpg